MTNQDKFYSDMGALIKSERISHELTQEQLASHLSLNRTSVTNIEKGKQKILVHTLLEIANCMDVPVERILPKLHKSPTKSSRSKSLLPTGSSKEEHDFFASAIRRSKNGEIRNGNSTKAY